MFLKLLYLRFYNYACYLKRKCWLGFNGIKTLEHYSILNLVLYIRKKEINPTVCKCTNMKNKVFRGLFYSLLNYLPSLNISIFTLKQHHILVLPQ